jgi:hypothetical protein
MVSDPFLAHSDALPWSLFLHEIAALPLTIDKNLANTRLTRGQASHVWGESAMFARLAFCVLVASLSTGLARTQELTADECQATWPDVNYVRCSGYLMGIAETLRAGLVVRATSQGAVVTASSPCADDRIMPDELAAVYVTYVEQHPERVQDPPIIVAANALLASGILCRRPAELARAGE